MLFFSPIISDSFWKPETIIAACALFVSGLALAATAVTTYFQWLTTSAALITNLSFRYDSLEIRKNRKEFAQKLLDVGGEREKIDLTKNELVLEFFEDVGYLTRKRVLHAGMVWNNFFWDFERYYQAVVEPENLFVKVRNINNDKTIYKEMDWLSKRLVKIEIWEKSVLKHKPPVPEAVQKFLKAETLLESESVPNTLTPKR